MTKISDLKQGRSPYATKGKTPFRYSDEFYNWQRAVGTHGIAHEATIAADVAFRRRFSVPLYTGPRVEFGSDV